MIKMDPGIGTPRSHPTSPLGLNVLRVNDGQGSDALTFGGEDIYYIRFFGGLAQRILWMNMDQDYTYAYCTSFQYCARFTAMINEWQFLRANDFLATSRYTTDIVHVETCRLMLSGSLDIDNNTACELGVLISCWLLRIEIKHCLQSQPFGHFRVLLQKQDQAVAIHRYIIHLP